MTTVLPAPATPLPGWSSAWSDALADLEMSVAEAEALLASAHTAAAAPVPLASAESALGRWTPPVGLGLLPVSLAERAAALLDRQLRVARELAEAAAHSRRQLRAIEGMRATSETGPVYIDTAG